MKKLLLCILLMSPGILSASEVLANFGRTPWTIDAGMKDFLPSGDDLASILELWYIGGIVHGSVPGGMHKLHPLRYHVYGGSHLDNQWHLNGFNITDPGREGTALLSIPFLLWDSLEVRSFLHTASDGRGLHLNVDNMDRGSGAKLRSSTHVGGPFIIFRKDLFDRDPLYAYEERFGEISNSSMQVAVDASAYYSTGNTLLLADYSANTINYVYPEEFSSSSSAASLYYLNKSGDTDFRNSLAAISMQHNDVYNAWYGHSEKTGNSLDSITVYGQTRRGSNTEGREGAVLGYSAAWKYENLKGLLEEGEQLLRDFASERTAAPEPEQPHSKHIGLVNAYFNYNAIHNSRSQLVFKADIKQSIVHTAYHGTNPVQPRFITNTALDVLFYNDFAESTEAITSISAGAAWVHEIGILTIDAYGGLSNSTGIVSGNETFINFFGPDARLAATLQLGRALITAGGSFEPGALNHGITGFLSTDKPGWNRYDWTDSNDNGLYDTGEEGVILGRYGNPYHSKGDFNQPWESSIYAGTHIPFGKTWSFTFNVFNRIFFNPLRVVYASHIDAAYTYDEVAGVYERTDYLGEETYELGNYDKYGDCWGIEFSFISIQRKSHFFSLSATAYLVRSYSTLGNGILYNDLGILDYYQANPNSLRDGDYEFTFLSGNYRLSSDRAFMINIAGGAYLGRNLLLSGTLRYRDGEPFKIHNLVESSAGMEKTYSDLITRYTFFMDLSLRLQYTFMLGKNPLIAAIDGYNLLGSNTELKEYAISGGPMEMRNPVEAVPGRTIMASLKMVF